MLLITSSIAVLAFVGNINHSSLHLFHCKRLYNEKERFVLLGFKIKASTLLSSISNLLLCLLIKLFFPFVKQADQKREPC